MKKNVFLFALFIMSILLNSCSNDSLDSTETDRVENKSKAYVFAYKINPSDLIESRAASLRGKVWPNGETIRIKFLNGNSLVQERVKEVAVEWLNYANLKFEFVSNTTDADVKISFAWNGEQVTWSTIGTDCKSVGQNQPSMNLMIFDENDESEVNLDDFSASILREFGHVLGLIYENQGPNSNFNWNMMRVKNYFRQQALTEAQINDLMQVYSTAQTNYTEFDENSIMLLFFPGFLTTDNKPAKYNTILSEIDKSFISTLYPKNM